MNRGCDLPLESYRLAKYAMQVPCHICEGPNAYDSELCRHCFAPMALSHQASDQRYAPQMVAVLGASGVGKTVFLGMLMDLLSRRSEPLRALARGAFSITLQQNTVSSLARCEFPPKTPNEPDRWNWVHCLVYSQQRKHPSELILPDMAGEAILEEISHPNTYPVIRSLFSKCSGVILLIDAIKLQEGSPEEEHFALKALTCLSELKTRGQVPWSKKPISIVLSKSDQTEMCFQHPEEHARQHAPSLWKLCQSRFRHVEYFATGVAGACAYRMVFPRDRVRIPLRVEPRGIVEPFEWMVGALPKPTKLPRNRQAS